MYESEFDQNKKDSYFRAKKRVDRIKGFYKHLAIYIIINIFLLVLKYFKDYDFNDNFWRWETFNVVFFWGIGIAIHFINVFGFNFILGKNWEEQKIKELMDNDKFNN